jgi:hypothetical protein
MLAANGSISTIIARYSARIAYGWRTFGLFYLGSEAGTFVCVVYRPYSLGAHLTGFKTGALSGRRPLVGRTIPTTAPTPISASAC